MLYEVITGDALASGSYYGMDNAVDYTASGLSNVLNNGNDELAEIMAIVKAVIYDNPQYFWIFQNGFIYELTEDVITFMVDPNYITATTRASAWSTIQSEINNYLAIVDDCTTPYEVEAYFHNAIIDCVEYAFEAPSTPSTANKHHTIEGAFTTEKSVVS